LCTTPSPVDVAATITGCGTVTTDWRSLDGALVIHLKPDGSGEVSFALGGTVFFIDLKWRSLP